MKILSFIGYYGRLMALVAVGKAVVPMYRSTGRAGVKGEWFPFGGILIPPGESGHDSMLTDFSQYSSNDYGWIVKMATAIVYDRHRGTINLKIRWTEKGDHRNVNSRLSVDGDFPVDLFRVSRFLSETLDSNISVNLFAKVNEEGVNVWIRETTKEYFKTLK